MGALDVLQDDEDVSRRLDYTSVQVDRSDMAASVIPLRAPSSVPERAALPALLPEGKLVELSGTEGTSARTTVAIALVLRAQQEAQPCAWVQPEGGGLFPPDLVARGIDLDALVVVHVPRAAGAAGIARAAELVLRSGGFGCVVVDMASGVVPGPAATSRLAQLAREHEAWLVVMTEKPRTQGSLGPLVGVRASVTRARVGRLFHVRTELMKDKAGIGLDPGLFACDAPLGAG